MVLRNASAQRAIRLVSVHASMRLTPSRQEMAGDQPSSRSALAISAMKQSWSLARRGVGVYTSGGMASS